MIRRAFGTAFAVAWLALLSVNSLTAQGTSSAAVRGRIVDNSGLAVVGAVVVLQNGSTGQRFETRSGSGGAYNFENVAVGGPYILNARSIGYQPVGRSQINLSLGQSLTLDLQMTRAAIELAAITVTGEELQNPLISSSHTGAATIVSGERLKSLPSLSRNFTDFIQTAPQVINSSVAGQNNRFNNIQIDGGINNDLFGLAPNGAPGGQANAKAVSLEAVREYQVLIAPFDVRQGGFTGGLVNAITKSGTNTFHGSLFTYVQDTLLSGRDTTGVGRVPAVPGQRAQLRQVQYGLSFGGPIIRDKLHFFFSTDLQTKSSPFTGTQNIGLDTTGGRDSIGVGIRQATATQVQQIAISKYGFDPGTWQLPSLANPDRNVFFKLTGQVGKGLVELSYNYVNASNDIFARSSTINLTTLTTTPGASLSGTGYQLTQSGYALQNITNTVRAKWVNNFGKSSNELLLGYNRVRDHRDIANRVPLLLVGGDRTGTAIGIGGEPSSQANLLSQDIYEVTDNFTIPFKAHRLTLGTHNEFFKFYNVFQQAELGIWTFQNLANFNAGTPNGFVRTLPGPLAPPGPSAAQFSVRQLGAYVQDQWTPGNGLTLTLGVRGDVPLLDKPPTNPALQSQLAINTGDFPSGNLLISPRLGFNYEMGDRSTVLRGGLGLFTGRPPYVWVSNAFGNTGLELVRITCSGGNVPAFTVDPENQPTSCGGVPVAPTVGVVYYDPGFKFPQTFRTGLGVDRRLVMGIVGTVDFVFTRWVNQFYINDSNLNGVIASETGEGGRSMYGTISATSSTTTPSRKSTSFNEVLRHYNASGDRSWSLTFQLQRNFRRVDFNVGYNYSQTKDLMSLTSSIANSNFTFATLDGTLDARNLRTSFFDVPHKITASGTVHLPLAIDVGIFYVGRSGSPYAYTVSGDANGDGKSGNDIIYVPRDSADINLSNGAQWAALNSYINAEACLANQRGHVMERNSCRNPWTNTLNARVAKIIRTIGSQSLELSADFFNFLVLSQRQTTANENQNLLTLVRYDGTNQRGVYSTTNIQNRNALQITTSRWRIQVGAKYTF